MAKLQHLLNIEKLYKNDVLVSYDHQSEQSKPKYFSTFPYPYMNGRLHLGHAYTIMDVELQTRYKKARGYNVLFPFGFHGSGMPIYASSIKLKHELENITELSESVINSLPKSSQIKILFDMNIPIDQISNFTNPYAWVPYFSKLAKDDLNDYHLYADFSRSFFTTDANPYYDSFIKWQFTYLINKGLVHKGVRNVIYSLKDNQPCADHDRQIGENIKPLTIITKIFTLNEYNFLVTTSLELINTTNTINSTTDNIIDNTIVVCGNEFVKFSIGLVTYISNKQAYLNISRQYETHNPNDITLEEIDNISSFSIKFKKINVSTKKHLLGTGFYLFDKISDIELSKINYANLNRGDIINIQKSINELRTNPNYFLYDEPSDLVISRSGDKCTVAKTTQWMINYNDDKIKLPIKQYVSDQMIFQNDQIKKLFEEAVDLLDEWPVSRSFGLGTCIPGTNELIDSLSDSTIYMAYYTVSHLIEQIPIELLMFDIWDYIFLNADMDMTKFDKNIMELLNRMKTEFNYWYPLDLRASGKDLISNHLSMALLNHQAIWEDNKYFPREYHVNGYLLLNGEKMSKSTGNFMTIREAIDLFGTNATRLTLANSFSTNTDDGNFVTVYANSAIIKLYNEIENLKEILNIINLTNTENLTNTTMWEKAFEYEIYENYKMAEEAYETSKYSNVVLAFENLLTARNDYMKIMKQLKLTTNDNLIMCFYKVLLTITDPICPTWTLEMVNIIKQLQPNFKLEWMDSHHTQKKINDNSKYGYYKNILNNVVSECTKLIAKNKQNLDQQKQILVIKVFASYTTEELTAIENYNDYEKYIQTLPKTLYGKYKGFYVYLKSRVDKYGLVWLDWVTKNNDEEFTIINNNINQLINANQLINVKVEKIEPSSKSMFKFGPGFPIVCVWTI